jgi:hypothetical protein
MENPDFSLVQISGLENLPAIRCKIENDFILIPTKEFCG